MTKLNWHKSTYGLKPTIELLHISNKVRSSPETVYAMMYLFAFKQSQYEMGFEHL